jgi:hypothetical protein
MARLLPCFLPAASASPATKPPPVGGSPKPGPSSPSPSPNPSSGSPPTQPNTPSGGSSGSGSNIAVIAGAAVAVIVILALLAVLAMFIIRRNRRRDEEARAAAIKADPATVLANLSPSGPLALGPQLPADAVSFPSSNAGSFREPLRGPNAAAAPPGTSRV